MQLARWLAKSRSYQHRRHLRPRDALLADREQPLAQHLKPGPAPQRKRQIHIAKLTRALDADALQPHRHRQLLATIIEQLRAFGSSDQPVRQRPCLQAALLIEFAELRHRLLNDPTTNTHAAHNSPIAMNLAVFAYRGVAQIHAPESIRLAASRKYPRLALHAQIPASRRLTN